MANPQPKSKITPRNVALGTVGAFIGGLSIWMKANSEGNDALIIKRKDIFLISFLDVVRDIRFIYRAGKTRRWLEDLQNKEVSGADFFREALKRYVFL
jgi:hypothetical protein